MALGRQADAADRARAGTTPRAPDAIIARVSRPHRHRRRPPGRSSDARGAGAARRSGSLGAASAALAGRLLLSAAAAGAIAIVTTAGTTLVGAIVAWLLAVNATTALSYAADRRAARRGERRIPELVLHGLAAFGGSPAALVASGALRHKTRKTPFLRVLYVTVAAQGVAVVAALILLR